MKQNTIALIEGGRGTSDQTIFAICREFNVNEAWLRTGEGDMFIESDDSILSQLAKEYELDSFEKNLVSNFLRLQPEQRKAIRQYVKLLAEEPPDDGSAILSPAPPPQTPEPPQDLAKKVAELERQNKELADKVAALEKEAADAASIGDSVRAAEAAYEKSLGIVPRKRSLALSTTDDMEAAEEAGTA